MKEKFFWFVSMEKPILEMLLVIDKRLIENSLFKLKNKRKIATMKIK